MPIGAIITITIITTLTIIITHVTAHARVLSVSRSVRCDRARGSQLLVRTRRARRLSFGSLRLACALL